jgi:hypothetical protein
MRESHYDYMKRRMREEDCREGICRDFMSPWDAARRIRKLEDRVEALERYIREQNANNTNPV